MTLYNFFLPEDWFKDKSLIDSVYKYLNPYGEITWEEIQEIIKDETRILQYLKDNNLENMERAFDEEGRINKIF